MTAVWDLPLPPAQKLVLLKLADCANDDGRNAYPSVGLLVSSCTMSRRTVQRVLAELVETGHLVVDVEASHHRPTTYRVHPDPVPVRGANLAPLPAAGGASSEAGWGVTAGTGGASSATHNKEPYIEPSGPVSTTVRSATPDDVVRAWNDTTTPPFPKVRPPLHRDRHARLVRACAAVPDLGDWRALFVWMNGERWMRAPGTGSNPTWVATLDFVVDKPARLQSYIERAMTARPVAPAPRTAAAVRDATREAGVRAVVAGDLDLFVDDAGGAR
jgi:hypothetical protein